MSEIDSLFESNVEKKSEQKEVAQPKKQEQKKQSLAAPSEQALPEGKVLVDQSTLNKLISRLDELESKLGESGGEEKGNAAIEWQKLKAKEKAARREKISKDFYTQKDGKILLVTVKRNGAYSSYIGNNKKHKDKLKPLIAQWQKDGVWVEEYKAEEKIKELLEEIQKLEE